MLVTQARAGMLILVWSLFAATAGAGQTSKTCATAEVRLVNVSVERTDPNAAKHAEIQIATAQVSATAPGAAEQTVTVIALGPVLGSMDANEVKTDFACSRNGILLTASITRSANYRGAAAKNLLWNPKITVDVVLRQPEIVFKALWRMRLDTGIEVNHARTPPYPEQEFPIIVTKVVRTVSGQKQ